MGSEKPRNREANDESVAQREGVGRHRGQYRGIEKKAGGQTTDKTKNEGREKNAEAEKTQVCC